jgi:hypothetical protein
LKGIATAARDDRAQVLLTTQSLALLDGFAPESLRVVDLDERQHTRVRPLDPDQIAAVKDQLLDPGELLTVTSPKPSSAEATH